MGSRTSVERLTLNSRQEKRRPLPLGWEKGWWRPSEQHMCKRRVWGLEGFTPEFVCEVKKEVHQGKQVATMRRKRGR